MVSNWPHLWDYCSLMICKLDTVNDSRQHTSRVYQPPAYNRDSRFWMALNIYIFIQLLLFMMFYGPTICVGLLAKLYSWLEGVHFHTHYRWAEVSAWSSIAFRIKPVEPQMLFLQNLSEKKTNGEHWTFLLLTSLRLCILCLCKFFLISAKISDLKKK